MMFRKNVWVCALKKKMLESEHDRLSQASAIDLQVLSRDVLLTEEVFSTHDKYRITELANLKLRKNYYFRNF